MNSDVVLRYVGDGAFVFGVPATDLTQAQVDECGLSVDELLAFSPRMYELASGAHSVLSASVNVEPNVE